MTGFSLMATMTLMQSGGRHGKSRRELMVDFHPIYISTIFLFYYSTFFILFTFLLLYFMSWPCLRSTCSRHLHLRFYFLRCYLFWLLSLLPALSSYLPIKNIPECIEGFQHSSTAHETALFSKTPSQWGRLSEMGNSSEASTGSTNQCAMISRESHAGSQPFKWSLLQWFVIKMS